MMNNEKKPNFKHLRQQHSVRIKDLAKRAEVPPEEIYAMEVGMPVDKHIAQHVIEALSQLVNQTYTLDDVYAHIKKDAGT